MQTINTSYNKNIIIQLILQYIFYFLKVCLMNTPAVSCVHPIVKSRIAKTSQQVVGMDTIKTNN